ncbi:MAG TPA: diguanylate cyclase [Burkholderiales bacterium]|nr:diguanylate cyclase [Burkholderiales bacterium]
MAETTATSAPRERTVKSSVAPLLGGATLIVALAAMAGWLLQESTLIVSLNGRSVFNTAFCFTLAGMILLLNPARANLRDPSRITLAAVIALISLITLFEHLADWNAGIDWPNLHASLGETGLHPGRMPLVTSLMFLLYAVCCILMARNLVSGHAVRALLGLIVACGLLAMAGHALGIDAMFDINRFRLMSMPASLGFVLIGLGSWLGWSTGPAVAVSEDNRIVLAGAAVVLLFGVVIGLAGLIALKHYTAQSLGDGLQLATQGRANLIVTVLDDNISDVQDLAGRAEVARLYRERPIRVDSLRKLAEEELDKDYSAVEFQDSQGSVIAGAGRFLPDTAVLFSLKGSRTRIYWSGAFVMRGKAAIRDGTTVLGYLVVERQMPVLTAQVFDTRSLGVTGEISICSSDDRLLYCAPQRLRRGAFEVTRRPDGVATPMDLAIEGETGVMETIDYRQRQVLSAYAPVGNYGLGIVLKMDHAEIFEPLRTRLAYLVPLMVLVLSIGVLVLRLAVKPLAARLHASEKQLSLALQSSRLALWDWDIPSGRIYLSDQWRAMLGGDPRPTHTTLLDLRRMVHPEDAQKLDERLREVLKGSSPNYDVEHRVRAFDDSWIWVRSRGEIVERSRSGRALRMTGTNSDISARMEMQGRLLHQATHDMLTGLPNRSLFYDRLTQAIARSRRGGTLMAVLYLDIDKFKSINDTLGHDAGDDLLKAFSKRLAECVRATDTVARLGGDEYAVVLESLAGRDDGRRIAEKIVRAMHPPFALQSRSLQITSSVGVAFYAGESEVGPDGLVKRADDALYRAKHAGRNNYQVYEDKPESGIA